MLESEWLIVLLRSGNPLQETRRREGATGLLELTEGKMTGTQSPKTVSTKLCQIADLARRKPGVALSTLAHHIDAAFLHEAFRRTRKDGASGVDGQSAEDYAVHLEENLQALLNRFKTGTYRAPPVRRVQIPKGQGKTRPIGIPTFEDKVLQRAVAMVLESVYEQDFMDFSYGFRPNRSAHDALKALWKGLMDLNGGFVVEVDIKGYFDSISHKHLRDFLDQRVRDGVIRRTLHKWLNAGVMESGGIRYPGSGSPQGGVISPVLANVYLHEVMDRWFAEQVQPRLRGQSFMVRYADDMVIVCEHEEDVRRFFEVLPKRFRRYGLALHPDKTRLLNFRRPGARQRKGNGSFDFLGFTHYWGRSRRGRFVVKRKTAKDRLARSVRAIRETCRSIRHQKVPEQQRILSQKMRGHYAYYGITGNSRALVQFFEKVKRSWQQWLNRRSSGNHMRWDRFNRLLRRYPLPSPVAMHSVLRVAANP